MTLDEFLDIRETKKIPASEVRRILVETCGYCAEFIDTHCVDAIEYGGKENAYCYKKATCPGLKELGVSQFAYIKFYCPKSQKRDALDLYEHIYALVAGKTNLRTQDISFRPPEKPRGCRGDKAKWYIQDSLDSSVPLRWYHEEVLVVWTPALKCKNPSESTRRDLGKGAVSLERKIRQLFGLFSS